MAVLSFLVLALVQNETNENIPLHALTHFYESKQCSEWEDGIHYITKHTLSDRVDSTSYYDEFYGHRISHLQQLKSHFESIGKTTTIWLAGDSSLDNKYYVKEEERAKPLNGFQNFFTNMVQDVAYWINWEIEKRNLEHIVSINTAVEATTLEERRINLRAQDEFIRNQIQDGDYLVISVGGNDFAMCPSKATECALQQLLFETSMESSFSHLKHIFKDMVEEYILQLIGTDKRPKKIGVCMIYFPDMQSGNSWAEDLLRNMRYDQNPKLLQEIIRTSFRLATQEIYIPGVEIVPIPLFEVMDGTDSSDYVSRVEPSVHGGSKIANFIFEKLKILPLKY